MSVVLCANRLQDRREMEEALVHELVHVYDVRWGLGREGGREGRRGVGGWEVGRRREKRAIREFAFPFHAIGIFLQIGCNIHSNEKKICLVISSPPSLPPSLPSSPPSLPHSTPSSKWT